jgi:N utilization substance protein A
MNPGIMEALNQITRERRVDKALLYETLEAGLTQAIRKKYGNNAVVAVEIDEEAGTLHPYLVRTVVIDEDEIEDPVCQITLEEAKDVDPKLEIGDEVREELKFADFGRNAIALAKQVLVQRVREVERGKIFDEYKGRVGEIITGTVQQQDRTGVLLTLGKAEAFLPKKESIRRERWHQGLPIKAYVLEVLDVGKGPQVIVSRTHPGLVEKLFEAEVPEIYDDIVQIKSVARDAGGRSKIAVYSTDERVDAVGACVGMKGSRVQAVVKELSGERVDIVPWSEEPQQFVTKALSPARVQSVRVDRDRQEMTVVVDDEQLSLAIGREGQNVRLAVKLTGWRIDLVSSSEMVQRERLDKEMRVALDDVEGFDLADVQALNGVGLHTLKDLVTADETALVQDRGLDPALVTRVRALAQQRAAEVQAAFAERREAEQKLFDEAMFDRVTEEAPEAAGPTVLTFKDEAELPDEVVATGDDAAGGDEIEAAAEGAVAAVTEDEAAGESPAIEAAAEVATEAKPAAKKPAKKPEPEAAPAADDSTPDDDEADREK